MKEADKNTILFLFDSNYLRNHNDYKDSNKFADEFTESLVKANIEPVENLGILKGELLLDYFCKKTVSIESNAN
jgi:hypothetical protein